MEMLWEPSQELTEQEEQIASTMKRTRKLLPFLRRHRHEILDRKFQAEQAATATEAVAAVLRHRAPRRHKTFIRLLPHREDIRDAPLFSAIRARVRGLAETR